MRGSRAGAERGQRDSSSDRREVICVLSSGLADLPRSVSALR